MTNDVETSPSTNEPTKVPRSRFPNWAPWVVLGGVIVVGLLGGLSRRVPGRAPESSMTEAQPAKTGPTVTVKIREKSARKSAAGPSTVSPAVAASNDAKISVVHLVVSHKDSPLGAHNKIMRTREEAKRRADAALARAKNGEDFSKLVEEFSDEPGAAERQGKLGKFRHKDALKPFADAAFALEPGELSGVVETNFGFHVIRRTE